MSFPELRAPVRRRPQTHADQDKSALRCGPSPTPPTQPLFFRSKTWASKNTNVASYCFAHAFYFPIFFLLFLPPTMMSDPVLLPAQSFALPDGLIRNLFFNCYYFCVTILHAGHILSLFHWWVMFTACLEKQVRVCDAAVAAFHRSSILLFTVNSARTTSCVSTGSYRDKLTTFWTEVSPTLMAEPFTCVILSRCNL